jgi:hypothetical protein
LGEQVVARVFERGGEEVELRAGEVDISLEVPEDLLGRARFKEGRKEAGSLVKGVEATVLGNQLIDHSKLLGGESAAIVLSTSGGRRGGRSGLDLGSVLNADHLGRGGGSGGSDLGQEKGREGGVWAVGEDSTAVLFNQSPSAVCERRKVVQEIIQLRGV